MFWKIDAERKHSDKGGDQSQLLFFLSLSITLSMFSGASAQTKQQSNISLKSQLSADQATWDWEQNRFLLKGKVSLKLKVKGQTLKLNCDEASLYIKQKVQDLYQKILPELNQDSLQKLVVKGRVELKYKSLFIKTNELEYEHVSGKLNVSGLLKGRWGENRLVGRNLMINLHQGQAILSNPKFDFLLKKPGSKKSIWGR